MAAVLGSIFSAITGGAFSNQGSSGAEKEALKKQQDLIDAKNRRETSERSARGKIITARAAGPQTLFTRAGSIPRPRNLAGRQE